MKSKTFLYILIVFLLAMTSCSSSEDLDYGNINDVTIDEQENPIHAEKNVFVKSENNLGYEYIKVNSDRAMMSFEIPKSWHIKSSNQRHYEILAPEDDPILPGVTLHILHSFRQVSPNADQGVDSFEEFFSSERNLVYYTEKGAGAFYHTGLGNPSSMVTDSSISTDNSIYTMHIYDDAQVYDHIWGRTPQSKQAVLYSYVKWENTPHVFSIMCEQEKKEEARTLLNYITSTITYMGNTAVSMKEETHDGITLTLPVSFEKKEGNGYAVYAPTFESGNRFSGMAVGIFDLEISSFDNAGIFSFCEPGGEGEKISKIMYANNLQYMLGFAPAYEDTTIDGVKVNVISPTVDIFTSPSLSNPLEPVTNNYLTVYAMEQGNGKMKGIVYMGTSSPLEAGQVIVNSILTKTKINK